MKVDLHFYTTYALCRFAGIDEETSRLIAWADEFTDHLTKPPAYSIQTQCAVELFDADWDEVQYQSTVIVPFHFIYGDHPDNPRMVVPNSDRSRMLVQESLKDPVRFGIALHAYQDGWSHANFTGHKEKDNSCGNLFLPNIGHTDMTDIPDIIDKVWTDHRTKQVVNNYKKATECVHECYKYLIRFSGNTFSPAYETVIDALAEPTMAARITALNKLNDKVSFTRINEEYKVKYLEDFVRAARRHLACFLMNL